MRCGVKFLLYTALMVIAVGDVSADSRSSVSISRAPSVSISRAPSVSINRAAVPTINRAPSVSVVPSQIPQINRAPSDAASRAPNLPVVNRAPAIPVNRPAVAAAPPGAKTIIPPTNPARQTEVDRRMAMGQSAKAMDAFKADHAQFKALPVGAPATRQAAVQSPVYKQYGSQWGNADRYYAQRQSYIASMPPQRALYWQHPPVYVINARPSYGSYSGAFFGSLIGSATGTIIGNGINRYQMDDSYSRWAYAHRQSVEYQQWHADMMAQAEHDDDVRLRMQALDQSVQQHVDSGTVVDANTLPAGVDPSLVVAADTVLMATSKHEDADGEVSDNPSDVQ